MTSKRLVLLMKDLKLREFVFIENNDQTYTLPGIDFCQKGCVACDLNWKKTG